MVSGSKKHLLFVKHHILSFLFLFDTDLVISMQLILAKLFFTSQNNTYNQQSGQIVIGNEFIRLVFCVSHDR